MSEHEPFPGARADLVRSSLQSCYIIEHARAGLQEMWGFDADAGLTAQRADRLGSLLDEHGVARRDDMVVPHTAWFESLCGSRPDEVPLGAAVLHVFGRWADVFAGPYLGVDADDFKLLGHEHTRVDIEYKSVTEEQMIWPAAELPRGPRFVILTDIHIGSKEGDALAPAAINDINTLGPEFVVVPGDITDDGEPEQFASIKRILDGLNCPYYVVPGNHDAVQRSTRGAFGAKLFAEAFGFEPADEVIDFGELQIALVDSTDPTPSPFPDWDIATGQIGGIAAGVDSGALRPGQAETLAERLDKRRPTLIVQHHELQPFPGFPPVRFAVREEDAEAELTALQAHNVVGVVAGHTHRSAVLTVQPGEITQLEVPALKDWPYAYSVCTLTDDGLRVDARQVSDRDAVWRTAQRLPALATRNAIGPLSDLSYTFKL